MSIIESIGVFIIFSQLHSSLCQIDVERTQHEWSEPIKTSQCDCSNAPKEKEYGYNFSFENCPGRQYTPGCQPTVTKIKLNRRRSLNHRNSNVNVNTNTIFARRFLDDDGRGNININTNGDDADLDAALLLKNLGFIFPRPGFRHHQNHKRTHRGNHAASRNHGQRNRNVIVRTNGRDVGDFGDTNDNYDDFVYFIDDDAVDSPDNDVDIVAASRRSPFHPHSRY